MFNANPAANPDKLPLGKEVPASPRTGRPLLKPMAVPTTGRGTSVIGSDLTLIGEKITIVCQNTLQVDGDVRGNVHGKQVVITANGSVAGMVCAEKTEVHGSVRGSIRAVTVTLYATAQVDGDIMHHTLAISEGAHFDGPARRAIGSLQLMPVLDPDVIAASEYNESAALY